MPLSLDEFRVVLHGKHGDVWLDGTGNAWDAVDNKDVQDIVTNLLGRGLVIYQGTHVYPTLAGEDEFSETNVAELAIEAAKRRGSNITNGRDPAGTGSSTNQV